MISTTDVLLNHLALELLRLRGVSIASGTFGDAIALIKLNPLELSEAKQPLHANNEMPGNDMGFFIPIEPQENQDDSNMLESWCIEHSKPTLHGEGRQPLHKLS
ncbi:TPA: hypothetical protein ACPSKB_000855 [Legionella feeleii]